MTKFDKGILYIIALVLIILAFSSKLELQPNIVEGLVNFLTVLFGFSVGKKLDSSL